MGARRLDTLALAERLGALALSEQRYRALVETTSAVLWAANADGTAKNPSESWVNYTGQTVETHSGYGWLDVIHPDDRERVRERWLYSVKHQIPYEAEYRVRRPEGAWANVIARGVPLWADDGSVREWVGSVQDITALRRSVRELEEAQARLLARERLAAIGELSAAVAHEVRNPLGAIVNALTVLRRDVSHPMLAVLEEESERLNGIVGDLLDFAKPSEPRTYPESIRKLIEQALASVELEGRGVRVTLDLDAESDKLPMDARLMRQLLINLFENAAQAMSGGGRLLVTTRASEATVELSIIDSGPGVPEHLRGRIFDPFFTTKATGTGLGLAVVKRIAESHGGSVEVKSGARGEFCVTLPRRREQTQGAPSGAPPESELLSPVPKAPWDAITSRASPSLGRTSP